MKRHVFKVIAFLLLGLVINVAVAWTLAVWADYRWSPTTVEWVLAEGKWLGRDPQDFAVRPDVAMLGWQSLIDGAMLVEYKNFPDEFSAYGLVVRSGWPALAFQGERWARADNNWSNPRLFTAIDANAVLGIGCDARLLPLSPIWQGLVVNTLFYALMVGLLAYGPFAFRRFIRSLRGLCPVCSYDLRGNLSDGCPECGWGRKPSDATPGPGAT